MARAALGLACAPPPELRIALLGVRCEASGQGLHLVHLTMADAEELMRTAPRGSVPWAQGAIAYLQGTMAAGRIPDLLASLAQLRDVAPEPAAIGRMALVLVTGVCILDAFGQIADGTALEARFDAIVQRAGDREPIARFWWNIDIALRGSYAHDDPWIALRYSEAIREIYDITGGERTFLNLHLFRGMNLWFLGAFAQAAQQLEAIPAADEALSVVSSLRRFMLSWLRADRGALPEARALAAELAEDGRTRQLPLEEGRGRWVLAEVLRRTGELDAADREVAAALAMAVPLEHPGVLGTLAALRLAQGRAGDALAAAEDAIARCTAMGGCGMFRGAFVRLIHAEALHATGAHDAARSAIARARDQLLAIASRITDPDHRQSFLEAVPENARTITLARSWLAGADR
jgi:tetratricopeptide (TPR) repeat protein